MAKATQIIVETCSGCPFFERNAISFVADMLASRKHGATVKTGACKHAAGPQTPFPFNRMRIDQPDAAPPDACPLRSGPTSIEIKS